MKRFSPERKAAILKQMLPPLNKSVAELSRQEGVSKAALYTWRNQLREGGEAVPGSQSSPEQWSAEAKVAVVAATLALSEIELSEYCRQKGLFPDQVKRWKQACIEGQRSTVVQGQTDREQSRQDKKRIRTLEKELHRKERALAEAAALLVLRKKLNAFWDEKSDEDA